MTVGERIKRRRQELGMTQEELAHKLGNKSRASVCTVESGKEDLTTTRIRQYAEALDCSPASLMGWSDGEPETDDTTDRLSTYISTYHKDKVDEAVNILSRYDNLPEDKQTAFQDYLKFLESQS